LAGEGPAFSSITEIARSGSYDHNRNSSQLVDAVTAPAPAPVTQVRFSGPEAVL
jgi:hypothetical protein